MDILYELLMIKENKTKYGASMKKIISITFIVVVSFFIVSTTQGEQDKEDKKSYNEK